MDINNNHEGEIIGTRCASIADVENETTTITDAMVQIEERRNKKSDSHYTSGKHIAIACAACVILTYLATSYLLINYGLMFWGGGDSIAGLQKQLKEIAEDQSSCESVGKLAKAEMEIVELKNEIRGLELVAKRKRDNFVKRQGGGFARWQRQQASNAEREAKEMFQEVIDGLPPSSRAKWDHFTAQLNKDKEATVSYIKLESEKETRKEKDLTSTD